MTHGVRGDCVLTVMDWDAASKDDVVGSCKISAARMSEMFRADVGASGEQVLTLIDKGRPVVGHNKEHCQVTIKVNVSEVPLAFSSILPQAEASGPRRLEITLFSVEHLPKMDSIMGEKYLFPLSPPPSKWTEILCLTCPFSLSLCRQV